MKYIFVWDGKCYKHLFMHETFDYAVVSLMPQSHVYAAIIWFCSLWVLDSIFANHMVLGAVVAIFTNVMMTIQQLSESWDHIPWGDCKEIRRHPQGDRTVPSKLLQLPKGHHKAVTGTEDRVKNVSQLTATVGPLHNDLAMLFTAKLCCIELWRKKKWCQV